MNSERVVIVGASHAACELIASLRKFGWQGEITMIGEESMLPYHRPPLSKAYFQGQMEKAKLLIKPESAYAQVDTYLSTRALSINREAKSVRLDSGKDVFYSKLILATGTRARKLSIDGAHADYIHTLRTFDDAETLRDSLPEGGTLLIVGAGYIGLEVAASAVKQGRSVVILEAQERVLQRVTSPLVSEFYTQQHRSQGVDIRLEAQLQSFEEEEGMRFAVLSNGERIAFDCALVGIGVIPNIELAQQAALNCDNGIMVDEYCRTDDEDIYAIGDVCNQVNSVYQQRLRLESVPSAIEQAKKAAASICEREYPDSFVPWFWSDQYDLKLQTAGMFNGYDQVVVRDNQGANKMAVFYLKEQYLLACDAINSPAEFMVSKKLIANKTKLNVELLADPEVALKTLLPS